MIFPTKHSICILCCTSNQVHKQRLAPKVSINQYNNKKCIHQHSNKNNQTWELWAQIRDRITCCWRTCLISSTASGSLAPRMNFLWLAITPPSPPIFYQQWNVNPILLDYVKPGKPLLVKSHQLPGEQKENPATCCINWIRYRYTCGKYRYR